MNMVQQVLINNLQASDIPVIVSAFEENNLPKPAETFETYLKEQEAGERLAWVSHAGDQVAGYVTLAWQSKYKPFQEKNIPEIMDLNVLPPFRGKGIGSDLLDTAEAKAFQISSTIGIGVGLYPDYGSAQRIYVKRGYIPDGKGITYNYEVVEPGAHVRLDDDLVMWFEKALI